MISPRLLSIVRCPDCRSVLLSSEGGGLTCGTCRRAFPPAPRAYLDLRPTEAFQETTKYLDEALHADARHETVSPPLLSAAIRNDMLRAFLAANDRDRIVDLGCGSGRALVWNQDLGAQRTGVDVSPYFAEEALASVDLLIGDLRKLPIADASFTKAFSLDVAEHLSRESLQAMLREAARVLAPGGTLFIYTHVRRGSPLAFFMRGVNRLSRWLDRRGLVDLSQEKLRKSDHINPLADIPDLERVAAEAGFTIARIRYYTPIIGSVMENLVLRLAEGFMARRAAKKRPGGGQPGDASGGLRAARLEAKQRIAKRGPMYAALQLATWLMKVDVLLLGRFRSGPFFALLRKM